MARNAGIGLQVPTTDISRLGPQITLQVLHTLRNTIDVEINLAQSRANATGQQLQQTGSVQGGALAGASQTTTGRRQLSAQARNNIAKAQKKRWAQRHAAAQATGAVANGGVQTRGPGRAKRSQRTMAAGAGMATA